MGKVETQGINTFYHSKIEELELQVREKSKNLRRLEAQRNDWNSRGLYLYFFYLFLSFFSLLF